MGEQSHSASRGRPIHLVLSFQVTFPNTRGRATRVLEFRGKYVFHAGDESYFRQVKQRDRVSFIEDLLALYEACLIDLGRTWPEWDFMYPTDIEVKPSRSKERARGNKGK